MTAVRTLRVALDDILQGGGDAPGVDHLRPSDLVPWDLWPLCHWLAWSLFDGDYVPNQDRKVAIPKRNGRGTRLLRIPCLFDRIVAGAAALVLSPYLIPTMSRMAFGWRSGVGRQHALAAALWVARKDAAWVWIVDDIKAAFDVVPSRGIRDVLLAMVPEDVAGQLMQITCMGRRGVRQGSPASPLLVDLYFDRRIDQPFHRRAERVFLNRTADDLLACCRTQDEAVAHHALLSELARSAGTPLKNGGSSAIVDLADGQEVCWLGYQLRREGNKLANRIGRGMWESLESNLQLVQREGELVDDHICGWINEAGPCYRDEDRDAVVRRIGNVLSRYSDMPLDRDKVKRVWHNAHRRWASIRRMVWASMPKRLAATERHATTAWQAY